MKCDKNAIKTDDDRRQTTRREESEKYQEFQEIKANHNHHHHHPPPPTIIMKTLLTVLLLVLVHQNSHISSSGAHQIVEISLHPSVLQFGELNIGTARSQIVTIINHKNNDSVQLNSIGGETTSFYSSFFHEKTLPPQSNTTFNVIFLPRNHGPLQTNLFINTSFGGVYLRVSGVAKECPYMLKPLVGVKSTLNSTLRPEIFMYNPHANPITILEVSFFVF